MELVQLRLKVSRYIYCHQRSGCVIGDSLSSLMPVNLEPLFVEALTGTKLYICQISTVSQKLILTRAGTLTHLFQLVNYIDFNATTLVFFFFSRAEPEHLY